ncbi:MAG TPA: hypothetical protein VJ227_00365 [Patescibacteria group bacterium]|nr:hypothetical protein [Patescibacteria group bacterium]
MTEKLSGLLTEADIQTLTLGFGHYKDRTIEGLTLRVPVNEHESLKIEISTLNSNRLACDIRTQVEMDGGVIRIRKSTINEMAALYRVAKHMKPEERITHDLGHELYDAIDRMIIEHSQQIESLESLKRRVGL